MFNKSLILSIAMLVVCGCSSYITGLSGDAAAKFDTGREITKYSIAGGSTTISGTNISVVMPYGTNIGSLIATFTTTGASVAVGTVDQKSGVTVNNFISPVIYTVTAVDGTQQDYIVTVTVALSNAKEITTFELQGVDGLILGNNIYVTLPYGADLTALVPTLSYTGTSISPASGVIQNFSQPVVYSVTAANGTTQDYTVIASVAASNSKAFTSFSIAGVEGVINGTNITVTVQASTNLLALVATFITTGIEVKANGAVQTSGVTINNFSAPVVYRVKAANGTTQDYTVTTVFADSNAKAITSFSLAGVEANINGLNISVTVPYGTNIASITPLISHNGVLVTPAVGTPRNFTSPVTYTVTAENGTSQNYTVTVAVAPSNSKAITSFALEGVAATISNTNISVTVPNGTDITALTPSISHTGASISPAVGTVRDFSTPVIYQVTSASGSVQNYTVYVSVAPEQAKAITSFALEGVAALISDTDISLTVPFGTDLTSLTPSIVHSGVSITPAVGVAQDFTAPVVYTVTAEDGSTQAYTVTAVAALNASKAITSFALQGVEATISATNISVTVPYGTNLTSLIPAIAHTGLSISPAIGIARDFSAPTTYMVTAADGSTQYYTVTVTVAPSISKEITKFSILGNSGVFSAANGTDISVVVPYGTDITWLSPTITHSGVSISPALGVYRDFSSPIIYTVTAADGSTQDYTVTVTNASSSSKAIMNFALSGVESTISGTNISVTVPYGTNPNGLIPVMNYSGVITPAAGVARDFTLPVQYTVTAADGSYQVYTVTTTVASSTSKAIMNFNINGVEGVISGTNITLTLPYGTSKTSLTPTLSHTGSSISPASGTAQNFTSPVAYTVTAADGSTRVYTVTASVATSNAKAITTFSLAGVEAVISGTNISVTVPNGTNVTSLTPKITHNGASITPAIGATNFTNPVVYTVKAANASTQAYTVTVAVASSNSKAITAFDMYGASGTITDTSIALTVPYGTDITNLTPIISHTGASISPASGVAQNFSIPVVYTVTAANGSYQSYSVTVSVASSNSKSITDLNILGNQGTFSGTYGEIINVTVPYGTDLTSLTPAISYTGQSISPLTGVAQDFTTPVDYTVTAANGTTQLYTVVVTEASSSAKAITSFALEGVAGVISGTDIYVTVPTGTDLSSLVPTISNTGASINPAVGIAQDFTGTVTYTVTAANGSTQDYNIYVNTALSSAKAITSFEINGVAGTFSASGMTITVALPLGTDTSALVANFTTSSTAIAPVTIGGIVQDSGVTVNDFTSLATYRVTAADGTIQDYTVIVTN